MSENTSHANKVPYIFHSRNWATASFEQRMHSLQQLEEQNAEMMGRDPRMVRAVDIPVQGPDGQKYTDRGSYDPREPNYLNINKDMVEQKGFFEDESGGWYCARNVTHEGTHATQDDVYLGRQIDHDKLEKFNPDIADKELLMKDYGTYTDTGSKYYFRPSEYTARETANQRIADLHSQASSGVLGRDIAFYNVNNRDNIENMRRLDTANKEYGTNYAYEDLYRFMKGEINKDFDKKYNLDKDQSSTNSDSSDPNLSKLDNDILQNGFYLDDFDYSSSPKLSRLDGQNDHGSRNNSFQTSDNNIIRDGLYLDDLYGTNSSSNLFNGFGSKKKDGKSAMSNRIESENTQNKQNYTKKHDEMSPSLNTFKNSHHNNKTINQSKDQSNTENIAKNSTIRADINKDRSIVGFELSSDDNKIDHHGLSSDSVRTLGASKNGSEYFKKKDKDTYDTKKTAQNEVRDEQNIKKAENLASTQQTANKGLESYKSMMSNNQSETAAISVPKSSVNKGIESARQKSATAQNSNSTSTTQSSQQNTVNTQGSTNKGIENFKEKANGSSRATSEDIGSGTSRGSNIDRSGSGQSSGNGQER